jgi:hypothetical protein
VALVEREAVAVRLGGTGLRQQQETGRREGAPRPLPPERLAARVTDRNRPRRGSMDPSTLHDQFFHVRVIVGVVTGLSVTRLLGGLARFVQHPTTERVYPVHLGWTVFLLLAVLHFWWFEFGLSRFEGWSFPAYAFVIVYAALFFFTCVVLYPDHLDEYDGFADYFHARQDWFYGLLATLFLVDLADSALKGAAHLEALGPLYPLRQLVLAGLALAAMRVGDRRFHVAFVVLALVAQVIWIGRHYFRLA